MFRPPRCDEETCRAELVFLRNPQTGSFVPVDYESLSPEDEETIERLGAEGVVYDRLRHVSHFTTCKNPNRFRKGGANRG